MMRSAVPRALVVLLALVALALGASPLTAAPYREYEIRFGGDAPPPLGQSPSDTDLIDGVAWLMSHKLGLPFPAGTKAYIFVNEATLVDGLIQRMRRELSGDVKVVGTGGLAAQMREVAASIQTVNPNLRLEGLRMIWEHARG